MADRHLKFVRNVVPSADGCGDCLKIDGPWLHLRLCLTCRHVGCCDSSPNRHARKHFHSTGHPIIQSFEPGQEWRWRYAHEAEV
ncbi:MAG: UBP-type zinc finger domain-containing protein [Alphaproteobacteria bacterium]